MLVRGLGGPDLHQQGAQGVQSISVDKQSGKMSGGENQSPYFVVILASYLRAYKRHESRWRDPSLALVPIDEAFSKMDTGRIKDCIEAIKDLDLQGVFSMSTGNVPGAFSLCEQLIIVSRNEDKRNGRPHVRNVPVEMPKEFYAQVAALKGDVELRVAGPPGQPPVVKVPAK